MSPISDTQLHEIVQRVIRQVMGGMADAPPQIEPAPAPAPAPATPESASKAPVLTEDHARTIALTEDHDRAPARKVVALGADHGGYELKETLKVLISELGYDPQDVGTHSKAAVDYPDYAHEVARMVASGAAWRGIMIDGAGIGSCIVANKVPGVRAGMAYDLSSAVNSREHNDTNLLTLGAGMIGDNLAKQIVKTWLATEFGGERHQRRIDKISGVEKQYLK